MTAPSRTAWGPRCVGRAIIPIAAALAALMTSGCTSQREIELRQKIAALEDTIREKNNRLTDQQVALDEMHQQLAVARSISSDDLKRIFYPERLEIDRLSGGESYDGEPGDDGVTVYVRPIDRDGDVIKVAGDLRIQLYDLAAPPGENLIGEYAISADQIGKLWHGRLLTGHYTIKCPWPEQPPGTPRPPKHTEVTIRAVFVDYFTKRVISAQQVCKVKLPPR